MPGPGEAAAGEPPVALRSWFAELAEYIRIKRGLGDAMSASNHDAVTSETHGPVVEAISAFLRAGEADGSIRPGLDPDDVLMLMTCVWRVPGSPAGKAQAERLLDMIVDVLRPAPTS